MTQRKEMFHNASTGGKPGDNGENGRLSLGADLCPSRAGSLFLARCPVLQPPPLHFHQVLWQPFHSSPDLPNFILPQPEAPLQVLPHAPLPTFAFRILSNFLSSQSSRLPAGKKQTQTQKPCLPLFRKAPMGKNGTEKHTGFTLARAVTTPGPTS